MAVERSFTILGSRLVDLEAARIDRIEDSEQLRAAGRHSSAIMMGIYALEIALKVRICSRIGLQQLPRPFEIHDLEGLLIVSGLSSAMNKRNARTIKTHWGSICLLATRAVELRYLPDSSKTRAESEDFFHRLLDPATGVMPWILAQP